MVDSFSTPSWRFCSSGAAILRAGENADTTITGSGGALASLSRQAEGFIEATTRRKWGTNYSGLGDEIKGMLETVSSCIIAKNIINYNMVGFTSRTEAQTMLNVLDDEIQKGLNILKDFKSNDLHDP